MAWLEACIGIPRFTRRMTTLCWELTSSLHPTIRVEAYQHLLECLSPSQLQTHLPMAVEVANVEMLMQILLQRMKNYGEEVEEEVVLLARLLATLEGGQPTRHLKRQSSSPSPSSSNIPTTNTMPEKGKQNGQDEQVHSVVHVWNDANTLFNQFTSMTSMIVPLGGFVPSSSSSYDQYVFDKKYSSTSFPHF